MGYPALDIADGLRASFKLGVGNSLRTADQIHKHIRSVSTCYINRDTLFGKFTGYATLCPHAATAKTTFRGYDTGT